MVQVTHFFVGLHISNLYNLFKMRIVFSKTRSVIAFLVLLAGQLMQVSATVITGYLSESVTFAYDNEAQSLTISGTGVCPYIYTPDIPELRDIPLNEKVTSIIIGEGITRIDAWTFGYYDRLTSLTLPSTLKEIGYSAFKGCGAMTEIVVPDNVVKVEDDAFCDWDGSASLHIGKSLREFGSVAFAACDALRSITVDPENPWFETRGCNGIFKPGNDTLFMGICTTVIPEGIHYIARNAYIRNLSVTSVKFPSTLKEVGESAFSENYCMTTLVMNDSLETICDFAFWHCEALMFDTLYLPRMLRSLGGESFGYGPKARHIECYDSLRFIGICPFDLNDFESINLGNHVEHIEYGAFWSPKLKRIHLPATLKILGIDAFWAENLERIDIDDIDAWCHIQMGSGRSNPAVFGRIYLNGEPVTRVEVPDDIIELSPWIFSGFDDLREVILPYGLHNIGEGAFSNCAALEEVRIPPSVFELGDGLFGWSPNLKRVYLYSRYPGNCRYNTYVFDTYAEKYTFPTVYVPQDFKWAYLEKPEYTSQCEQGMVIEEFDMAEESSLAPALPKHLYLLRGGDEILEAQEFSQSADGIYTITAEFSYGHGGSFRFIQDQIDDWYVINYRDYFPVVDEWGDYTGGTFTLDIDDHGCCLLDGIYDIEVNMRTMQCTITQKSSDGVDDIILSADPEKTVKRIVDGQLILYRQGKAYNILGQEIQLK